MSVFQGHELLSNHGTSQGIIPRFFLQTLELAVMAFGKEEGDKKLGDFLTKNLPDFTNFYDLYQAIVSEYDDFREGLIDGRYFSIDQGGQFRLDRSTETSLHKKVKDFFILGRLLVNNFAKSGLVDSDYFKLSNVLIVSDGNFKKYKAEYLQNDSTKRFEVLFDIVEQARNGFLSEFNQIRADIEHQNLSIPKFEVDTKTGMVAEPSLKGKGKMINELTFYYSGIFDLVELLVAFYFGIEGTRLKPMLGLFERDEYNYSKMIYRFVLLPRIQMNGLQLLYP